jgi:FdhD protein
MAAWLTERFGCGGGGRRVPHLAESTCHGAAAPRIMTPIMKALPKQHDEPRPVNAGKMPHPKVLKFEGGTLSDVEHLPVREFPLKLIVNGRELATLIASPHDLRFLVAGFLRLQGFVAAITDFQMFSVCEDMGVANVRIDRELPERLTPVLTTGCGTGVTFTMPAAPEKIETSTGRPEFTAAAVFALMDELARRAEKYRSHGGTHSAAVGDDGALLLFAEDIGRHNTLDRIAGEALFNGIDLAGRMLAVSGRVSSEMAAKAAALGITLIASRTSPTDMAVRICAAAGIALLGYVRGGKFNVYCHPERLVLTSPLK